MKTVNLPSNQWVSVKTRTFIICHTDLVSSVLFNCPLDVASALSVSHTCSCGCFVTLHSQLYSVDIRLTESILLSLFSFFFSSPRHRLKCFLGMTGHGTHAFTIYYLAHASFCLLTYSTDPLDEKIFLSTQTYVIHMHPSRVKIWRRFYQQQQQQQLVSHPGTLCCLFTALK